MYILKLTVCCIVKPNLRWLIMIEVICCIPLMYTVTVSQKTRHPTYVDNFTIYWSIFNILSPIDSEQNVLYSPPYLTDVAALSCETAMFQKSYKFKNTLSKDVVLKYFCGCTCLISFSRQIRESIKNYEISVRIKYSVRDLIYDIYIRAWAAMTQ